MSDNALYVRDLLYPTDNIYEPGNVHVEVLNPNNKLKIPVIIESKTSHSPMKYINSIIRIMQVDIFDRILVDVANNVSLYIKADAEIRKEFGEKEYVLVVFDGDKIEYEGIDEIET